jgi:hypothetical protein
MEKNAKYKELIVDRQTRELSAKVIKELKVIVKGLKM